MEGVRNKRRGTKPPTSPRDRTSPPQIKTKKNKKRLKHRGNLRSRPIKDTERQETTRRKQGQTAQRTTSE